MPPGPALDYGPQKRQGSAVARPSSSVLLISPQNTILLLHRVRQSSAFPSAHVFPGGNLDPFHDGVIPEPEDAERHQDGPAYRVGAIRETFEESGILLARNNGFGRLVEVSQADRDEGRRLVHGSEIGFEKWLATKGGRADVDGLLPFTRWITPTNIPKRFTTQMYLYFLPLSSSPTTSDTGATSIASTATQNEAMIPQPTHDGGKEHTAARFLPASEWIRLAQRNEIILFPPQLFLLQLIAPFLDPPQFVGGSVLSAIKARLPYTDPSTPDVAELQQRRQRLREFVKTSEPPWGQKCISPVQILRRKSDGRNVLNLEKPGAELEGSGRRGEKERVVLVNFKREGPRDVEVRWRKDVLEEERESGAKDGSKL